MKKGFTMIELIFVIVILGILASVAIPRLASTRQDAEISAAIANIRTFLSDVSAYYVTAGKFDPNFSVMSNVKFAEEGGSHGFFQVAGVNCIEVGIQDVDSGLTNNPFVYFLPVSDNNNAVCAAVLEADAIKQILDSSIPDHVNNGGFCSGVNNGGMGCIEITSSSVYSENQNIDSGRPKD